MAEEFWFWFWSWCMMHDDSESIVVTNFRDVTVWQITHDHGWKPKDSFHFALPWYIDLLLPSAIWSQDLCFATAIQFSSRFTFQFGSKKRHFRVHNHTHMHHDSFGCSKANRLTCYLKGNPSNQCFGNPTGPLADSMFPRCSLLR